MRWHKFTHPLAGFQSVNEVIEVSFNFLASRDKDGKQYAGRHEVGYLPYNEMGVTLLELWKIAFQRKCMFTLGNRGAGG